MPHSSIDCFPCRLEWRPSRVGAGVEAALVILSLLALLATRWGEALPLALQALAVALALLLAVFAARRALRQPRGSLTLSAEGNARWEAGARVAEGRAVVHERWPVTTVRILPNGPTVVFWPDTLCDSGRRALRRRAGAAPEASPLTQFWMG